MSKIRDRIWQWMLDWLAREGPPHEVPLSDFDRLSEELRPGDVLLLEGRSRISDVIKLITQSSWTHSALYIGRLHDIQDPATRHLVVQYFQRDHSEQLLLEALLGEGTRISPLSRYHHEHLRICRPRGICPDDVQRVIAYAVRRLGDGYDVRGLLDLGRFFLPWGVLPRRWRSSLFQHHLGAQTRGVCSCLLAAAFSSVNFPILPFVERRDDGTIRLFKRNPRLFVPKDFDYSPYFEIIKYPMLDIDELGLYRKLPWSPGQEILSDSGPAYRAHVAFASLPPTAEPPPAQAAAVELPFPAPEVDPP